MTAMEFDDFEDDSPRAEGVQQQKTDLIEGMREYLAGVLDGGGEAGYTGADIGECGRVLDAYLATVAEAAYGEEEAVLAAMEFTVRSLNSLNARCQGHLIETDQREQLRALILQAASERGVGSGEDLTEPWREW
jgi:hypothetical protein